MSFAPEFMASSFDHLRSVRWRINLGVLPSLEDIHQLRRVTADSRRRYARVRRELLIDPHVNKFGDDSPDLEIDNPLSQSPDSMWGRFFRNAELEQVVDQDLSRLYPEHGSYFQTPACQGLLRRILLLWCLKHPECGYRQGMHELLAPLLYVFHADIQHLKDIRKIYEEHFIDKFDEGLSHESHNFNFKLSSKPLEDDDTGSLDQPRKHSSISDLDANVQTIILLSDPYGADGELGIVLSERFIEHDTYCMFDALMNGAGGTVAMTEFFRHSSPGATQTGLAPAIEASLSLYHLLSIVDSSLYTHLVELSIEPQYFALRWLRVLFGREFSLENLLAIWDVIFSFDNGKLVKSDEHDPGILYSPRGAFISAMAVSMMLTVRSSLLATEYTAACLQRLLNFPEDVDLDKLIGKAKSFVGLAIEANAPSHSTSAVRHGIHSKQVGIKVHTHSLSFDSSSPGTPSSPVHERYWEEKWRDFHNGEETKNGLSPRQVPSRRKSWTDKMKLRLSRSTSDPSPSKTRSRLETSVRRSLLEDLSRQLSFGEDAEETGSDKLSDIKSSLFSKSDAIVKDVEQENEACTDNEEHSPVFSDPASPTGNDSEHSSTSSSISQGVIDDGIQSSCSLQSSVEESLPISFAPDVNDCGAYGDDCSPTTEPSPTVSKERNIKSSKFQWFWRFGRHTSGEGTSDIKLDAEDAKSADIENLQGYKVGVSIEEAHSNSVKLKTDGSDQNLMCTLKNLGQSMLENIQVIESTFQQERSQALVEKGQVTALTALKELRKISNLLREM